VKFEWKMSQMIEKMPAEVKGRFQALKVLYDQAQKLDDEEEVKYRGLEVEYDKKYQEIYELRK
jgi:hypothetical protein